MPLFAGWFRHQRHSQGKLNSPAGVEESTPSSASGGLSRLASLTRGRLLRSGMLISQTEYNTPEPQHEHDRRGHVDQL